MTGKKKDQRGAKRVQRRSTERGISTLTGKERRVAGKPREAIHKTKTANKLRNI